MENYFPLDEEDTERATEKIVKESVPDFKYVVEKKYKRPEKNSLETIEKISRTKIKRKYKSKSKYKKKGFDNSANSPNKKNAKKSFKSVRKWEPQKIKLKKDSYELIVTEKPQAALKIASALGNPKRKDFKGISYYELERQGKKIIVACAVGHLFTLAQNNSGSEVPVFDINWVPNYLVRKKDFTKKYYDTLLKLAKDSGSLTIATDYDIEGDVIGLNVARFICGQKDASRMKFSTLTSNELNKSYNEKLPHLEWGQAIAGETRHHLDWFYGINLSRALMNAIKRTGRFKIFSIGRVQGPALNLIVQKEKEIQKFEPEPFWQVFITIDNGKENLKLKYNKDIFEKSELKKFENLIGKTAIAETKKTEQILPPNPPFNLTILQTEAYKFYGITPSRTLQIAQSLYLAGLISYPRTSSQKLPESIGYREILKRLAKEYNVEKLVTRNKPIEGKKSDSAHPSIYPTGNRQILAGDDEKIYNLITRRFLSLFCDSAIIDNKKVSAVLNDLTFSTRGIAVRKKAWMEIYPNKLKEIEIPDFNGEVEIKDSRTEQKETQPPKRYSPASIISQLEKKNLGTKATRSSILETLYDRGYVQGKSIEATPLGISLITTLEKYSPIIIDEKLTRDFEKEMEGIQNSKKDFKEKEQKILDKAKKTIISIAKDFEKNEEKIGEELSQANIELREQQKLENTLMKCPVCKKGDLAIMYSKKNRRYFVACNAYPACKNTYSLPPNGIIKKTDKICEHCGFPMLMRITKGRRPWIFCFNPKCVTNAEWAKKREETKGQ
jgi:DNA topoisomerase I